MLVKPLKAESARERLGLRRRSKAQSPLLELLDAVRDAGRAPEAKAVTSRLRHRSPKPDGGSCGLWVNDVKKTTKHPVKIFS